MSRMRFTKIGYEKLKTEYEDLKKQRPAVVEDLKKARELGDLSENGYYKASRSKLSFIDGRLTTLSYHIRNAIIIEESASNTAEIGKKVVLTNEKKDLSYEIVGDLEANPIEGKISLRSPLGAAIAGHKVGDVIEFETPRGKTSFKITQIS